MQLRILWYLAILISVTACTQTQVQPINLPIGISHLKEIDNTGFQFPIWSPDGTTIVASYVIEASPDFIGSFGPKPRHDVVLINPETWETSIFIRENAGNLMAEAWSPDSKSFAMFWSDGPDGNGIYLFEVDNTKSTYYSKSGALSPDLEKIAVFEDPYIKITDVQTLDVQEFKVPVNGEWGVYAWSSDMQQITLIYRGNEKDRFENIYLLELNSGNFLQFTNESSFFKHSPTFSPSGQLIAYIIWRFTENDIENKLLISRLDQSCEWTIPVDNIDYFAWSPDSQRMFLSGNDGVYVADLDALFGSGFSNGNHCP
jgi:Tol biopolymer transport system component